MCQGGGQEHRATWSYRAFLLLGPIAEGRTGLGSGGGGKVLEGRAWDRSDEAVPHHGGAEGLALGYGDLKICWHFLGWGRGGGGALNSPRVCRPSCGSIMVNSLMCLSADLCTHSLEAFSSKVHWAGSLGSG